MIQTVVEVHAAATAGKHMQLLYGEAMLPLSLSPSPSLSS